MSRSSLRLRLACGVSLAAVTLLLTAGPALASGGEQSGGASAASPLAAAPGAPSTPSATPSPSADASGLTPLVDCVQDAPLGDVVSRTIVLGYRSTASAAVTVPAGGGANDISAGAADRGQPTTFQPGEHHGVALLSLDARAEPSLQWRLGGAVAALDDSAPACTAATTVTLALPDGVEAGSAFTATAAVSRLLLAAPAGGSVQFSVAGAAPVSAPVVGGLARADLTVTAAGRHTVTARFVPEEGSGILHSTASGEVLASAPSGPLIVAVNSVVAGSASAVVTVSRSTAAGEASVDLATADGTARAGVDYTATATRVTLHDGVRSATVRVPLLARPAGSPAGTFFVLLQRASTAVTTASATVRLPAVAAPPAPAAVGTGGAAGSSVSATVSEQTVDGPSSALPAADPTAVGETPAGQDLLLMIVAAALTGAGVLGVVSVVRGVGMRDARA
ncbi:Calx-beta domain-containing protein [Leifsonia sp. F6_8S_P_1B]|uniref:Calx-beta domain-containing protein n=1 Tax=Leifsonia williamsii TaxID=3035919 RepID=A0ABT8K6E2_9MICO|nr:Calx-beta domain-containing protein [Leifsonia williamsii]MDN4612996.1 Calx-beta domain-containing protein [Leifsonia williamsii]